MQPGSEAQAHACTRGAGAAVRPPLTPGSDDSLAAIAAGPSSTARSTAKGASPKATPRAPPRGLDTGVMASPRTSTKAGCLPSYTAVKTGTLEPSA
jgi:hypothetical protein